MDEVPNADPVEIVGSSLANAYLSHSEDLVRFAAVLVGPDNAADIVSTAVVRLLDRGYEGIRDDRAYLFQVVANEARTWKRGESRRRSREEQVPFVPHSLPRAELYPEVRAAIEDLSLRQRAVVYLAYWDDLDDRSIAEHLGIGAGSVRRHLARARKILRGVLNEYD